ncbi:MAG: RNA methyltransferase [Salinivirgaceae bacterium]|nr:RNA methyltransferase [Salinivirgaceae bacterium]
MNQLTNVIHKLSEFITEERLELFKNVLNKRTQYITLALEDIYQSQNASAVLRTSDCFGIQYVHIIENRNEYNINPDVALGANKWLSMYRYNEKDQNTLDAIKHLKASGYRIVATTPHTNDVNLEDFDLNKGKAAFFFGTELMGLSQTMLDNADEYLKIPMHGFTESFNISVSASIILHHLTNKLRNSELNWQLSSDEKQIILFRWLMSSIKRSEIVVKELCQFKEIDYSSIAQFL